MALKGLREKWFHSGLEIGGKLIAAFIPKEFKKSYY